MADGAPVHVGCKTESGTWLHKGRTAAGAAGAHRHQRAEQRIGGAHVARHVRVGVQAEGLGRGRGRQRVDGAQQRAAARRRGGHGVCARRRQRMRRLQGPACQTRTLPPGCKGAGLFHTAGKSQARTVVPGLTACSWTGFGNLLVPLLVADSTLLERLQQNDLHSVRVFTAKP